MPVQARLRCDSERGVLIDSHCHIDSEAFDGDRAEVLSRAYARGVRYIIIPAVTQTSWSPILALARAMGRPRCAVALGLHPASLPDTPESMDEARLCELANLVRESGVVAIGECGLDVAIDLQRASLARQRRVLLAQLALAARFDLPVILHARGGEAYNLLADILAEAGLPPRGGVIHSYGGGVELLRRLRYDNLYFGFAGPVTFAGARKVHASLRAVAAERVLAETDAPDQTPSPHRPGRSEPGYVLEVIAAMASLRAVTSEAMAKLVSDNALRLFRLPGER